MLWDGRPLGKPDKGEPLTRSPNTQMDTTKSLYVISEESQTLRSLNDSSGWITDVNEEALTGKDVPFHFFQTNLQLSKRGNSANGARTVLACAKRSDSAPRTAEGSTDWRRSHLSSQRVSFHLAHERKIAAPISLCQLWPDDAYHFLQLQGLQ